MELPLTLTLPEFGLQPGPGEPGSRTISVFVLRYGDTTCEIAFDDPNGHGPTGEVVVATASQVGRGTRAWKLQRAELKSVDG